MKRPGKKKVKGPNRDFSKKLPKPIGGFLTLADVRNHIAGLDSPSEHWLHLGALTLAAADGGSMDDVAIVLHMMRERGLWP